MADQYAIMSISRGFENPEMVGTEEKNTYGRLMQHYPYFTPVRYITAAGMYQDKGFSPAMLSSAYPYIGNWILFWEYAQGIKPSAKDSEWTDTSNDNFIYPRYDEDEIPATMEDNTYTSFSFEPEPEIIKSITESVDTEASLALENNANAIFDHQENILTEIDTTPVDEMIFRTDEPIFEEEQTIETLSETTATTFPEQETEQLFTPAYSEDYFMQQGIKAPGELPQQVEQLFGDHEEHPVYDVKDKSLMVMMSFTEWLLHFKNTADKQKSEIEEQRAIKMMWQKEKLAAALEEENEEIPENVFEMAVNSITKEEGLASESLAEIYRKQGKYDKAIEMYRKLSLTNPEKNAYFARKIEEVLKDKQI